MRRIYMRIGVAKRLGVLWTEKTKNIGRSGRESQLIRIEGGEGRQRFIQIIMTDCHENLRRAPQ